MECHVRTLPTSREEGEKRIEDLERELSNCSQEIDYLQDQLNMRNSDIDCLSEQLCILQFKLEEMENITDEVGKLREDLRMSEYERSLLLQEIEDKEIAIRYSESLVEKLEETISSMGLEYQCEIESTKLESLALEHNLIETKKLLEEKTRENFRMSKVIKDLELRIRDPDKVIESLDKENRDLREKFQTLDLNNEGFVGKVEEQLNESLPCSTYGNTVGPHLSKLTAPKALDADLRDKMAEMSRQIDDYELLVRQLKEELREQKLKANDEAEDMAQEMAELRYQLTSRLDEECKRRASIEQISLHRISELEAQVAKERQKSVTPLDLAVINK